MSSHYSHNLTGGLLILDRKRVRVTGKVTSLAASVASPQIVRAMAVQALGNARAVGAFIGTQKFVSILCRFGDLPKITP